MQNVCIFIFAGVAANLFLKSKERKKLAESKANGFVCNT